MKSSLMRCSCGRRAAGFVQLFDNAPIVTTDPQYVFYFFNGTSLRLCKCHNVPPVPYSAGTLAFL
jgi:hypothetical protein